MFAKTIVTSDAFLDMPLSARCLYFTLGMLADDDGFVNSPKSIMRQVGASQDDLNLLLVKRFILAFDSGVIVIKHWRIHNYIQKDRYKESKYIEEKATLMIDEKGAYTFGNGVCLDAEKKRKPLTDAQQNRLEAKKESSLPYAFDYKIRQAFHGEICPICNCVMDGSNNLTKPTIQHNLPISLGGKHEIDNISVICSGCNCSIKNNYETPPYNTEKVKSIWERIGDVSKMDTQVRLGKDRLGKDRLGQDSGSVEDEDTDTATERDILKCIGGKIGRNVVYLTDRQFDDLLDQLGLDAFNRYVDRLSTFIIEKNAHIKNHYEMILKWHKEDTAVSNNQGKNQNNQSNGSFDTNEFFEAAIAKSLGT